MAYSRNSLSVGIFSAAEFNFVGKVLVGSAATGAQTYTLDVGYVTLVDGTVFTPYATNAPLSFDIGSNNETVTPSAVTGGSLPGIGNCTVTATFSNAHGQGCIVQSGTAGLQEAINFANSAGGGAVVVDANWAALGGTTAMIAAAVNGTKVSILDYRGANLQVWSFNGTGFAISPVNSAVTTILSASGAVSVKSQYGVITKAGVAALTLAAPTAAQNGTIITLTSRTANAHTLTATGLINDGTTGSPHNLGTFAAFPGAGIQLIADNLLWNVTWLNHVTIS